MSLELLKLARCHPGAMPKPDPEQKGAESTTPAATDRQGPVPRRPASPPGCDQKRCVYISCRFSCLCVMAMPCPLVTLTLGATVTEPLNSLAGAKR